jgi:Ca2+-binding EF-hand superfamily protein
MDDDNSKNLNKYEFGKAVSDYMLGFTPAETNSLFAYFDVDGSGTIDYNEFLRAIQGPMNQNRKKFVA